MKTPLVQEIRVRCVRVPMAEPHRTASGVVGESPLVLVDAILDEGTQGHGLLFTYTTAALEPVGQLVKNMAPLVVGKTLAPASLCGQLSNRFRLLGTQGLVGMAIAGIDMALWDAFANWRQLPLARLLGGEERRLPAYGAVGYDGAIESARVAERWAKRGFRAVKAKIGYTSVEEDIEVVKAMREAAGGVRIMIDYNQSLTVTEAIARLRALDDLGLTWVEEPVRSHDFAGHARVAAEIGTPIQAGENWWGPLEFRHAIEEQATDLLMLDVMKVGGVTGWRQTMAMAETHGIPASSHLWPEISAQLLSVSPLSHWLEYADWWNPILARPLAVEDGLTVLDGQPGSGVAWNEAAVERWRV